MPILNYKGEDGQFHSLGGLLKGDPGNAGVVIGDTKPTDPNVKVWINSAGDPMTAEQIPVSSTDNSSVATALGNKVPSSRTINGKPLNSDIVLSASDLEGAAADSNKLGGKAPEYYLQPRNLLDNSDFRNPVNQRGQSSYSFDSGYTIDRWYLNWSDDGTLSIADGYITLRRQTYQCYMFQKMDNAEEMVGKTYTAAAKCRGSGTIGWIDSAQDVANAFEFGDWGVVTKTFTVASATHSVLGVPALKFNSNSDKSVDVAWIVLYEGEYTADTLPPYVPKGYAAELAECRRYYRKNEFLNCVKTTGNYFSVSKSIEMRSVPAVEFLSFAPYGSANITNFNSCNLSIAKTTEGVQRITYAELPTCSAHSAGGLSVNLNCDL